MEDRTVRKMRNISLQRDHQLAIDYLKEQAQIGHSSPIVQEMIERRMFGIFGEAWRESVRAWAAERAMVPA